MRAGNVTSTAQISANRRNAKRSSGPRTTAGKSRAARNALRHGLTVKLVEGSAASERVQRLAWAFLGNLPQSEVTRALASAAAEAQYFLELTKSTRVAMIEAAAGSPEANRGLLTESEIPPMCAVAAAPNLNPSRGHGDRMAELEAKIRSAARTDQAERVTEVYGLLSKKLIQLDRYERRALVRRRRAIQALAYCATTANTTQHAAQREQKLRATA